MIRPAGLKVAWNSFWDFFHKKTVYIYLYYYYFYGNNMIIKWMHNSFSSYFWYSGVMKCYYGNVATVLIKHLKTRKTYFL